jgi:hypothetical protein
VILFITWACSSSTSPESPDVEGVLKEADIRVEVNPNPIFYNYNHYVIFTAIFKEYDGVEAELQKLWMLSHFEDGSHYVRRSFGYMCPKKIRSLGELELDFNFYAGRLCYAIEIQARFLDENGHEFDVKRKFSVK